MTQPDDAIYKERLRNERPLLGDSPTEIQQLLNLARQKVRTKAPDFNKIEIYSMFIGYPRSGHSIVGSMLDAHDKMIIAHELNALKFIEAGCNYKELYWLLLYNSQQFARFGRNWGDYQYEVPGQWQGRFSELKVIGDKKGGTSSMLIGREPDILLQLEKIVPHPIRFIHVVRNPYDNIATLACKDTHDLNSAVRLYFQLCHVNEKISGHAGPANVLTLRHEDIIAAPEEELKRICSFLNLPVELDWLTACAGIVADSPSRTRQKINWTQKIREMINSHIDSFGFLNGYCFED